MGTTGDSYFKREQGLAFQRTGQADTGRIFPCTFQHASDAGSRRAGGKNGLSDSASQSGIQADRNGRFVSTVHYTVDRMDAKTHKINHQAQRRIRSHRKIAAPSPPMPSGQSAGNQLITP